MTMQTDNHSRTNKNQIEVPDRHRLHVRLARAWALARGRALDPVALIVLILAKEECFDAPAKLWVLDDLAEFVWSRLTEWCAAYEVARPPNLAEALWVYLEFLDATGELAPGSDDLAALQTSLMAYGGLDPFGRPRTSRASRPRASRSSRAPRSGRGAGQPTGSRRLAPIIPLRPVSPMSA
jgi:hypothetical protein